ncbi:MAG TPA: amino acid adenylation domain-containing protein [Pyrinomonadaceae bacterium]|jgi:fengycin family lipopeptide synthetase D
MMSVSVGPNGTRAEKELQYWLRKLADGPALTGVPPDFERPPGGDARRAVVPLDIDAETRRRLDKVCGGSEVLIFAACVAALKICLYRYSGVEDVVVGTAINEQYRSLTPHNELLLLRDRVGGGQKVRQLLEEVLRTITEAYAHQRYPFQRLLQKLGAVAPPFHVAALLENINRREHIDASRPDVVLALRVAEGGLSGEVEYQPELFRPETVQVFARHLGSALRGVVSSPDSPVSELELLSEERRRELVVEFNETSREYPRGLTVAQLFDRQAQGTPESVAAVCEGQSLTYRELQRRSNQLAHCLRGLGTGRGALVGVYMNHSLETLVGILGALKAGAAYVPLEPAYPLARTAYVLSNAGISVLLTQQKLLGRVGDQAPVALCLDADWEAIAARESGECPPPTARPEDLAYVIYTSGSTGSPKGVEVQHSALVNYVCWAKETYLREDALDFPLYSSLAFDLTVTSLFVPLVSGRSLYVYPQREHESSLDAVLADNRVGVLKLTPSHLALLRERDNRGSRVERLIVGGEALETGLAARVLESFGGRVEIYNEYGPTEATVGCMVHLFDPRRDTRAVVPIGRPAANTQIYLLDEALRPLPENVPGELYISGAGLARGFLRNGQQTAARFIDNPLRPGHKMYKTGDVARWLPEGVIEYIGRNDEQVKYHGYRLDLNEVRIRLNLHPGVKDSAALLLKDAHGQDALVAYYVSARPLDVSALRATLARHLPPQTIPGHFIHLEEIPLTSNGKPDRRKLPTLEEARQRLEEEFVAPRTPAEQTVAGVWAQLLGVERVGVHDDFFELGGHSLLAYQVVSRLGEAFRLSVPMRSIFDHPTVAGIALLLTRMQLEQEDARDVARMIEEIKSMSPDEVQSVLAADGRPAGGPSH